MNVPLSLLATHTVADFFLQSDWMASNKSKKYEALFLHVLVYSACFLWLGIWFALFTFVTHFLTDFVTSRITSRLWFFRRVERYTDLEGVLGKPLWVAEGGNRHWFFVTIGFDQLIHFTTLSATYRYLFGA